MKLSITLFFMVFMFPGAVYLQSQTQDIRFEHITIEDGLSQSAVFAILEDSKGFMWFGTKDGLNKYDGYSFTVYSHDPFDSTTISHNYIKALLEDSHGYLWVGTLDGGLNRFDRKTETFQRFLHDPEDPKSLSSNNVSAIVEDKNGNIWIGTADRGLNVLDTNKLDLAKPAFFRYTHDPDNQWTLDDNRILAMAIDQRGSLWVGTEIGLNEWPGHSGGRFRRFRIESRNPQARPLHNDNAVSAIFEDVHGRLWLGTLSGVALFDRNSNQITHYPNRYEIRGLWLGAGV